MPQNTDPKITAELRAILRCPHSHQPLREVTAAMLAAANKRIAAGTLFHADQSLVAEALTAALCSDDNTRIYRITEGIPILLASRGMLVHPSEMPERESVLRAEKEVVQTFYDEQGWMQNDAGAFVDAEKWEDLRPVSAAYIHACHERLGELYQAGGGYFLDVASGPIQYPEYLQYSARYQHRVCVDLSLRALRAAREKLSPDDLCVLADITNLPFADNTFAGIASLHTIYHVANDEQKDAFCELHRVQMPDGAAAVVYSWGQRSGLMRLAFLPRDILTFPYRTLRKIARTAKRFVIISADSAKDEYGDTQGQDLYFRPHDYRWFTQEAWSFRYEIRSWRSVSVNFLRTFIHAPLGGRVILRWLFRRENTAANCYGKYGQYPLIILHKDNDRA